MTFKCSTCNKSYSRKDNLVAHVKKQKCVSALTRKPFICANCNVGFATKASCARHIANGKCYLPKEQRSKVSTYVSVKKKDEQAQILHFESNAEFLLWKDSEEQKTLSKYSQPHGFWKTKKGKRIRYICHRAGKVRERLKEPGLRRRNLKSKGSCKINNDCTAYILYEENLNGEITVQYNPNHSNHDLEMKHVPISSVEKEIIADKLRVGVPLDQVLDDIRDSLNDTHFTRTHLITKHELHNIMIEKKISYQERKSLVDIETESVASIIDEYRTKFGDDTPFKYYKESGERKDQFAVDDFFLVIMSPAQIALMKKFGPNEVCIDSTHATNDYDYYLNTVLVVNDLNMRVPVAHAISNKENTDFMKKFFQVIEQECGVIRTNTFISDDFFPYLEAWTMVMEKPNNTLCKGMNTDKKIEAMHRELKNVYFHGLKNKRLDTLITTLLRMNRKKAFDRVSLLVMEMDSRTLKKVKDRHQNGEKIPTEDILIINDNIAHVNSQSNRSSIHVIKKIADRCYCKLRCEDCRGICVHLYECTCNDYVYGYNICKHLHAYALKIQFSESPLDIYYNEQEYLVEVQDIYEITTTEVESEPTTRELMREMAQQILQNIERCNENDIPEDEDDTKALSSLIEINNMLEMKLRSCP